MRFLVPDSVRLAAWAIASLGIVTFFSGCLVSKDKYEQAIEETNICRLRTEQCEHEVSELERGRQALQKTLQQFEKDHQNLLEQMATLQSEREEMAEKIGIFREQLQAREQKISQIAKTYQDFVGYLSTEISEGKIRVDQSEKGLKLNLVDKILFPSGSSELTLKGKEVLEKVGFVLKDMKDRKIQVEGHADNVRISPNLRSRFQSNWELSTLRAAAVARFLDERVGIDPRLLAATGYSSYQPVSSNDTLGGRQENRRIEVLLLPLTPQEMERLDGNPQAFAPTEPPPTADSPTGSPPGME
jgi:chemotaxis protein MotB